MVLPSSVSRTTTTPKTTVYPKEVSSDTTTTRRTRRVWEVALTTSDPIGATTSSSGTLSSVRTSPTNTTWAEPSSSLEPRTLRLGKVSPPTIWEVDARYYPSPTGTRVGPPTRAYSEGVTEVTEGPEDPDVITQKDAPSDMSARLSPCLFESSAL